MMMIMIMVMMRMKMIINICFDCHDTLFRFIIDNVGYRIFYIVYLIYINTT